MRCGFLFVAKVLSEGLLSFCNGCGDGEDRSNGRQSLRLDGRIVCNIKMVGISQAKRKNNSLCLAANPPPFDKGGKFSARRGCVVLLQWLWEWKGSVQREGRARQGCLKRVCPKFRTDAKPKKHTQTLALRKASRIVRFWEGWGGAKVGEIFYCVGFNNRFIDRVRPHL